MRSECPLNVVRGTCWQCCSCSRPPRASLQFGLRSRFLTAPKAACVVQTLQLAIMAAVVVGTLNGFGPGSSLTNCGETVHDVSLADRELDFRIFHFTDPVAYRPDWACSVLAPHALNGSANRALTQCCAPAR